MNKPFFPERLEAPLADYGVSISELKRNPAAVIAEAQKHQMAITNRRKPVAYLISPKVWAYLCEMHEDVLDSELVRERLASGEKPIRVTLDDLLD